MKGKMFCKDSNGELVELGTVEDLIYSERDILDGSYYGGNKEALRRLGISFPEDGIKRACQNRLNMMFVNSYRNIEI